jgi:hypothetical protein
VREELPEIVCRRGIRWWCEGGGVTGGGMQKGLLEVVCRRDDRRTGGVGVEEG